MIEDEENQLANDALLWRECCLVARKCPGTQDVGLFPALLLTASAPLDDNFLDLCSSLSSSKRGVVVLP